MNKTLLAMQEWIDARFPMTKMWKEHASEYYAPKNFNFWYYFGVLSLLVLVIQLVTGIFLAIFYKPDATLAFASVEYIMRDVNWGWLIRYMHSTGASFFFLVVYLHMFRAFMYGSYRKPRELLWIIGMLIYVCLMAEAFFGYLLPWGQMSYWGAQVIISLFGAIPFVGETLALWIRGDYVVSDATLNRFAVFHFVLLPIILLALAVVHILALHHVGSNNPDGIEIKEHKDADGIPKDGIPFSTYYLFSKDLVAVVAFLIVFSVVIFFMPEFGGWFLEHNNFLPADPLATPEHIVPLWYLTPFYAMLRAVPDQFGGVIVMFAAILVPFFLPWLDRSPVKSIRYKGPIFKLMLAAFAVSFIVLGYLGTQNPTPLQTNLARFFTIVYFGYFALLPFYSRWDSTKPVPDRVTFHHH